MLSIFDTVPRNSDEFNKRFSTEEACTEHFINWRWPNGFICPRCPNRAGGYLLKNRNVWQCMSCKYHCSIRAGTVMDASKKSLRTWFRALFYMIEDKDSCSALGLKRRLGLNSYQTAWTWFQKLRENIPIDDRPLSGRVEIDVIKVGGKGKGGGVSGRGAPKLVNVYVAVECAGRGSGRVKLKISKTDTAEEFAEFLNECVAKGTIVRTDGEPAIKSLTEMGYFHERIVMADTKKADKDEKSGKKKRLEANLMRIYRVNRGLERILNGTHMGAVAPWRLQGYLNAFAFMFDRKASKLRFSLFEDLLEACIKRKCRTYKQIISDEKEGFAGYSIGAKRDKGRRVPVKTDRWWKPVQWPMAWPNNGEDSAWAL